MSLDDKPLESLSLDDLDILRQNEIPEGKRLEYKELVDLDSSAAKSEFLKDITAFANASGGHLVFGIRESKGVPDLICGLDLENPDHAVQRIQNLLRDSIEPRLASVGVKLIKLEDGKYVIVLRISKSWNGPHMVKTNGRFYLRQAAVVNPMDVSELRNAFLQSASLTDRIRRFRAERLAIIESGETALGKNAHPKAIAHIIPFESFNPGYQINWSPVATQEIFMHPLGRTGNNARFNLDGFMTFRAGSDKLCEAYLQLFRNGTVETADFKCLEPFNGEKQIAVDTFESDFGKLIRSYLYHLPRLGIAPPFAVAYSLIGVRGYGILTRCNLISRERFDRDNLIIPEVVIENTNVDLPVALKPIFDAVWNAAGYAGSQNFGPNGVWEGSDF